MKASVRGRSHFRFRLYIAGGTLNSLRAVGNLKEFCRATLSDAHEIEIIDVLKHPMRALDDGVLMTPTLVKISPQPVLRIVGTLSETDVVCQALGLATSAP